MPSPTTAGAIIRQALALTNSIGVDQTLTSQELQDCLDVFNDIIEDFNTQNLALTSTQNQTFVTVAGQALYTIGTGGNWSTTRPIRINSPGYCTYGGVDFPIYEWDQATYNLVGLKTQQQPIVQRYLYVNDFPLSYITLWPVPAQVVNITLSIDGILSAISSASAALTLPMGYAKTFKYKVAEGCAPLFGKRISAEDKAIMTEGFANLQRVNQKTPTSRFDQALVESGPVVWSRGY